MSTSGASSTTLAISIGLAHWNPHWQCFVSHPSCAAAAKTALTEMLTARTPLDFFNVVELEDAHYGLTLPPGWASIAPERDCGHPDPDWDTLFYRSDRWALKESSHGCLVPNRSYAAGTFQSKANPAMIVAVLGAHFPQTLDASTHAYEDATKSANAVLGRLWNNVPNKSAQLLFLRTVFLGDTNTEGPKAAAAKLSHHGVNKTNGQLMADMGLWAHADPRGEPPGAPLFRGCCFNDNFSWEGDRIIANFGKAVASKVLFDPAPAWAEFDGSEFHKGVYVVLNASVP